VLHPPVEIAPKTRRSGGMIGTSENDPARTFEQQDDECLKLHISHGNVLSLR
jgi:hypothetical protein